MNDYLIYRNPNEGQIKEFRDYMAAFYNLDNSKGGDDICLMYHVHFSDEEFNFFVIHYNYESLENDIKETSKYYSDFGRYMKEVKLNVLKNKLRQ